MARPDVSTLESRRQAVQKRVAAQKQLKVRFEHNPLILCSEIAFTE